VIIGVIAEVILICVALFYVAEFLYALPRHRIETPEERLAAHEQLMDQYRIADHSAARAQAESVRKQLMDELRPYLDRQAELRYLRKISNGRWA
jgi:hypothetical protein